MFVHVREYGRDSGKRFQYLSIGFLQTYRVSSGRDIVELKVCGIDDFWILWRTKGYL